MKGGAEGDGKISGRGGRERKRVRERWVMRNRDEKEKLLIEGNRELFTLKR